MDPDLSGAITASHLRDLPADVLDELILEPALLTEEAKRNSSS